MRLSYGAWLSQRPVGAWTRTTDVPYGFLWVTAAGRSYDRRRFAARARLVMFRRQANRWFEAVS